MNAEQWTAKVHARRLAGGKHGSFQQTRNTTNNMRSVALASYLYKLRTTKFAFSPIGSGLDCHRHYEILSVWSRAARGLLRDARRIVSEPADGFCEAVDEGDGPNSRKGVGRRPRSARVLRLSRVATGHVA